MRMLNDEQRAAVERLGQDVCVVAGPGSGKTRVLTYRFHWLVTHQGVPPDRILAVTFTNKAANQLKERLVETLRDRPDRRKQMERAYVSTIHGFCMRLLRENAIAAGVDIGFQPIEEPESRWLLREAAVEALDGLFIERPAEAISLMDAIAVAGRTTENTVDLATALIDVYGALRAAGDDWRAIPPAPPPKLTLAGLVASLAGLLDETGWKTDKQKEERSRLSEWVELAGAAAAHPREQLAVLASFGVDLRRVPKSLSAELRIMRDQSVAAVQSYLLLQHFAPQRKLLLETIERLDAGYRRRKRAISAVDFSDLEERALYLLDSSDEVRQRIRGHFEYILMDELQDTNPLQWEIINRIRRPGRFFAVGDINQSIYGFRHAEPEVFRTYEESLKKRDFPVDQLETNYRTCQEILDVVTCGTDGQPGIVNRPLRDDKRTPRGTEPRTELLIAIGAGRAMATDLEARWVAERIRQMIAGGAKPSTIAVLARKMKVLGPVSAALRELGIPSITTGGQGFYEARETLDLALVCNALGNVHDEISLAGLLRSPFAGCRDETLPRLRLLRPKSLWAGLAAAVEERPAGIGPEELERLAWIHGLLSELRADPAAPADRLLGRMLDESGYLEGRDAQGRANIEQFLRRLRERYTDSGRPLAEIAVEIARAREESPEAEAPPADAADAVQLMSIHASKGLEFPVVFLPGLDKGSRDTVPAICRSQGYGIGVRWINPVSDKHAGDAAFEAVKERLAARGEAEEWRLLYVAMTRAEQQLILSWASDGKKHGGGWAKALAARFELPEPEDCSSGIIRPPASHAWFRLSVYDAAPEAAPVTLSGGESHEPAELPAPEVDAQYDSAVAVTHVSAFAECPRKYYLRHFLGFQAGEAKQWDPEDPEADLGGEPAPAGGAEVGSQVHKLLAGEEVESPLDEALALAAAVREMPFHDRIEKAVRAEREYGVLFEVEDVILRGQIDVWFEEDGRLALGDYKTDRLDPESEPERLRPYQLQLRLYAIAIERLTGRLPEEAWLILARTGRQVRVPLDEEAAAEARGAVRALKEAQEGNDFPLLEGTHCGVCEFWGGICPAGRAAT